MGECPFYMPGLDIAAAKLRPEAIITGFQRVTVPASGNAAVAVEVADGHTLRIVVLNQTPIITGVFLREPGATGTEDGDHCVPLLNGDSFRVPAGLERVFLRALESTASPSVGGDVYIVMFRAPGAAVWR